MNSTTLTGVPLRTYQALTGNVPARNTPWCDIRALLEAIGKVTADPEGNLTTVHNGQVLTLHPALTKDVGESGEVPALRRFLRQAEAVPPTAAARDPHLLLVIHGHEAQLYRCQVIGGIPQLILPYQNEKPNAEPHAAGKRPPAPTPGPNDFFVPMAEELQIAGQIVVFGVGAGSEAATFVAWLKQHDSALSSRIMATARIDEQDLHDSGLLAAAREVYATLHLSAAPATGA